MLTLHLPVRHNQWSTLRLMGPLSWQIKLACESSIFDEGGNVSNKVFARDMQVDCSQAIYEDTIAICKNKLKKIVKYR